MHVTIAEETGSTTSATAGAGSPVETHSFDWRLCLGWLVIGTISAIAGSIPTAVVVGSVVDDDYLQIAGIANMAIGLLAAGLQGWLLWRRGVSAALWVGAAIALVVVEVLSLDLLGAWSRFLMQAFGVYDGAPDAAWMPFVFPLLLGLPFAILASLLQGLVLAMHGPKSRLVWWVLACMLGYAVPGLFAELARDIIQVAAYMANPDYLNAGVVAGLICDGLVRGFTGALVQGMTLGLLFTRGRSQPFRLSGDRAGLAVAH